MKNPIEIYLDRFDAQLFPCCKPQHVGDVNAKVPLNAGWRESNYDRKTIMRYWESGHPIAWALSDTDLVVDIDAPTELRPDSKGLESLKKLNNLLGSSLSDCATEVTTGETGGSHFYLQVPIGLNVRSKIGELPGIDFKKRGGYVVIAGSQHWLGGTYNFTSVSELNEYQRPNCPDVLLNLIQRADVQHKVTEANISGALLSKLLGCLPITNYEDHGDWFPIFVASHQATGGSAEGLEVFDAWSQGAVKYEKRNVEYRWKTFDPDVAGGITIATLFKECIDAGHSDVVSMAQAVATFDNEDFEDEPTDDSGLFGDSEPEKPKKKQRQKIVYHADMDFAVNDQLIAELAKIPNVFQRSKNLVTISGHSIHPMTALSICEQLSAVVDLGYDKEIKSGEDKGEIVWTSKQIPERTGKQIGDRGLWFGVRNLKMVTTIPVLTPTGILQNPGYDAETGVYYVKTLDIPPIRNPSSDEAQAALTTLFRIVDDFPFAGRSHRSAWLAALLAIVARPAIAGPVPLTFVDGNQRGVGKGLLTDLVNLTLFGEDMPKHAGMPKDEKLDTLLLSIAMMNCPVYNFDNLPSGAKIGSAAFDSVLTSGIVTGRPFFKQTIGKYPIDTVFFASGNRIALNPNTDMIRRINYINLQSKEEKAEHRNDFKIGGESALKRYVLKNRVELVHAALTILEFARQSDEVIKLKPWGSYEAFSNIVRRAIVLLGEPDPILTRGDLESRDETRTDLEMVIAALEAIGATSPETGLRTSEIVDRLNGGMFVEEGSVDFAAAYRLLVPAGTSDPLIRCGVRLSRMFRDQVCSGRWIKKRTDPSKKSCVFWVESVAVAQSGLFV